MSFITSIASGATLAAAGVLSLFGASLGHVASTTETHKTVNTTCIATAVAAREASLDAGIATLTTAISANYQARAASLASNYNSTGTTTIKTAVKTTWSNFSSSEHSARAAWNTTQKGAWSTFATAVKACGSSAAEVSDSANASADASTGS